MIHPSQAVRCWSIRTVRRVLRQRTDLQEIVKELIRAKGDREERREEARGPVSVLFQHMKILGWTLADQLVITRKYGTRMHLTKGEDQLFDHWLREDVRRAIWSRDQAIRNREDLKGIAGTNIDYASTVQMMRAKKQKKGETELLNHVRIQVSMNLEDMRIKKDSSSMRIKEET